MYSEGDRVRFPPYAPDQQVRPPVQWINRRPCGQSFEQMCSLIIKSNLFLCDNNIQLFGKNLDIISTAVLWSNFNILEKLLRARCFLYVLKPPVIRPPWLSGDWESAGDEGMGRKRVNGQSAVLWPDSCETNTDTGQVKKRTLSIAITGLRECVSQWEQEAWPLIWGKLQHMENILEIVFSSIGLVTRYKWTVCVLLLMRIFRNLT